MRGAGKQREGGRERGREGRRMVRERKESTSE